MSFLRPFSFADVLPPIQGPGIELRAPEMRDFEAWAALRSASRAFLRPWEPTWPANDLTRSAFRARLRRYSQDVRADAAYPLYLFRTSDGALLGGLTLGQIRRGVAQTGSLGYWMGEAHAGQGYMTAAVRAVLPYAFTALRLRRIEAACLPENIASIRLLERVGFTREGYARSYLCIAGAWRDHLLYAILADDEVK
ncbi:GNAT family N-acetyltransferase [Labrys monachus]|uniref:Ribosomal-protein-alanine N-acetyltransferase n=1 Tax=Labrys monachus TaxID=217067 RepID=A0ABU0FAH7_9HYPH|nr:GNAT family protein [Labrys monachus]MDQ0391551.1 ribosomal-protein-alanine N-acetyltransferase [Labrys monachus]